MSTRRKAVLIIVVLLAILIVILAVVVPRLADIDRYRPEVVARIEQGSGRSASIGRLELRVLPVLAVRVDDIDIGNPTGFPAGHFLEIRRVDATLDAGALLHRQIVIRALKLEDPKLSLVSDSQGRWNTEMPARSRGRAERLPQEWQVRSVAWQSTPAPASVIARVSFEHGHLTAANVLPSGALGAPSVEADGISAELKDVNTEALGLHLAQGGDQEFEQGNYTRRAHAWPPPLMNVAWTALGLQDATPAQTTPPPQGARAAHGTLTADSARFGDIAATGIKSGVELYADGLVVKNIVMQLFGGQMTGDLLWNPSLQPPRYTTHLSLAGIDVQRALMDFPTARGKLTGKLEGKIELTGWTAAPGATPSGDPLASIEGSAALTVRDGTLPAIRLNRDLTLLMKNVVRTDAGSPDPSSFRSMSGDFAIGQGEIRSRQIVILGNGINLTVSGSVSIAGAGKLDYRGTGEIMARKGVGSLVAGLLGSKMGAGGKITFPFTLTGTLAAPRFDAPLSPLLH